MKPTVLLLAAFAVLQNPMLCCSFISVQPWNNAISNLKVPTPASYFGSQSTLLSSSSLSGGSGSDAAYGSGMNQQAMMESDMLITVDAMDRAVPNTDVSKKKAHAFNSNQPRGIAHLHTSLRAKLSSSLPPPRCLMNSTQQSTLSLGA